MMKILVCVMMHVQLLSASGKLWQPSNEGYTPRIKPFWFGANASGLDSAAGLAEISRYPVAGYGWQQGHTGGGRPRTGDELQSAALANAKAYFRKSGNNKTMLFTYRQIQVALRLFEPSAIAADNSSLESFWLHDPSNGVKCMAAQPWGTHDPFWNFSNPAAADYWLNEVIKPLTEQPALKAGRGAVFFDEVDQGNCGYSNDASGCSKTIFNQAPLQSASNEMYRRMVSLLNDAGIVPILSLDNQLEAAGAETKGPPAPCNLPEDNLIKALHGLEWVRFYENWPETFWVFGTWQHSPQLRASMIQNAILEGEAGIPTGLHSGGFQAAGCPAPPRHIARPGYLGGQLEFYIAAYLIVQSPGTTISISNGWYDSDFCWRPEFDVEYGWPLGPAVRTNAYAWERQYTKAIVKLDVSKGRNGSVYLLAENVVV